MILPFKVGSRGLFCSGLLMTGTAIVSVAVAYAAVTELAQGVVEALDGPCSSAD